MFNALLNLTNSTVTPGATNNTAISANDISEWFNENSEEFFLTLFIGIAIGVLLMHIIHKIRAKQNTSNKEE